MTIKNEHLSAVFDSEADEFEQRRLIDELTKDNELQQTWLRYSLVGDVLREPTQTEIVTPDFLAGIQDKLDAEESYTEVKVAFKSKKPFWTRPAAGFAMAATIAVVSVFSMQSFMTADNADGGLVTTEQIAQMQQIETPQASTAIKPTLQLASSDMASRSVVDVEQRIKMQRYLASHIKNASRRTIAPTMRVISYNYQ